MYAAEFGKLLDKLLNKQNKTKVQQVKDFVLSKAGGASISEICAEVGISKYHCSNILSKLKRSGIIDKTDEHRGKFFVVQNVKLGGEFDPYSLRIDESKDLPRYQ